MRVSVIVPTINGLHLLRECLPRLEAQTFHDFETIVVDDGGSTDGTIEFVKSAHPRIRLVELKRNQGFAGACNAGLQAARGEYVAILGNDNRPEPTWLEELVKALETHPEAAIVESRSVEPTDKGPHPFQTTTLLGYNKILDLNWPTNGRPEPTFRASGNAVLCRRALIDRFFDPEYFAYSEDTSLSWRLRLQGWQVLHAPRAVTHHGLSQTTKRNPHRRAYLQTRNRVLNLLTHYERGTLVRLVPWLAGDFVGTILFRSHRLARLRGYLWIANHWARILQKRRAIQERRRRPDRDLFPYFAPPSAALRPFFAAIGMMGVGKRVGPKRRV